MDDELPTHPLNHPPHDDPSDDLSGVDDVWLVSYSDDDDREMTPKQISEALGRGEIDPNTIVWREGMPEWKPISALEGLKTALRVFSKPAQGARKKKTVLGGFAADVSRLPVQPKPATRLGTTPDGSPGLSAQPGQPRTGGAKRNYPRREFRTLQGLPLNDVPSQSRLKPADAEAASEGDNARALAAPTPVGVSSRKQTPEAPTAPLPDVDELAQQIARETSVETEQASSVPEPTTRKVPAAPAVPSPRRRSGPGRPSRPPPAHHPSQPAGAPVGGSETTEEPVSPAPDSVESLAPSALESIPAPSVAEPPGPPSIFNVDLKSDSEPVDMGEAEAPRPSDRAGDSVLTGPADVAPPSIDLLSPGAELGAPRLPQIDDSSLTPPLGTPSGQAALKATHSETRGSGATLEGGSLTGSMQPVRPTPRRLDQAGPSTPAQPSPPEQTAPKATPSVVPRSDADRKSGSSKLWLFALLALAIGGLLFVARPKTESTVASAPSAASEPAELNAPPSEDTQTAEPAADSTGESMEEPEAASSAEPVPAPTASAKAATAPAKRQALRPKPSNPTSVAKPSAAKPAAPAATSTGNPTQPAKPSVGGDPESVSAGPAGAFDRSAASAALSRAAGRASACRKSGDPSGVAQVSVTFSTSGRATRAIVTGPPFAGTATGGCIASAMRGARVPKFTGDRVTVRKKVVIN